MKVRAAFREQDRDALGLTCGYDYEVLGLEADRYRLIDDDGRPCLFRSDLFEVVDATRPAHWFTQKRSYGEFVYAPELSTPHFFERFFDSDEEATRVFYRYLNRHMRLTD